MERTTQEGLVWATVGWVLSAVVLSWGNGGCRKEETAPAATEKVSEPAGQPGRTGSVSSRTGAGTGRRDGAGFAPGDRKLRGGVRNGPGGPRSVIIDHPALPKVGEVLAEIRKARALKSATSTDALVKAVLPKLRRWSDLLVSYSEQGRRREADLLSAALVDLQAQWGDKLFPPEKFDAFVRDRFEVKKRVVFAAQFFKPVAYHKDKRGAFSKYYRFSVYVRGHIVWRYYLESLKPVKGPETFILAKVAGRRHIQVADLGKERPSYWEVRKLVRKDLIEAVSAGRLPLQ